MRKLFIFNALHALVVVYLCAQSNADTISSRPIQGADSSELTAIDTTAVESTTRISADTIIQQRDSEAKTAVTPAVYDTQKVSGETIIEFGNKIQYRSPQKAFFLSLIIPGLGEWYTGSKIKAGIALAVEAVMISSVFYFRNEFEKGKVEYKKFADQHFAPKVWKLWKDWVLDTTDVYINDPDLLRPYYDSLFSSAQGGHDIQVDSLGNVIKDHDYYEAVGKWDLFGQGWDDVDTLLGALKQDAASATRWGKQNIVLDAQGWPIIDSTDDWSNRLPFVMDLDHSKPDSQVYVRISDNWFGTSKNQEDYTGLREKTNQQAGKSRSFLFGIASVHFASAFIAAYSASHFNRKYNEELFKGRQSWWENMRFDFRYFDIDRVSVPQFMVHYKF